MARPQSGDEPINVSFNCKMTETESSWLSSLSYTTGYTKSEVVRRAIRFAYSMVGDVAYRVRKEEEKAGIQLSINEMRNRILELIEDQYQLYSNPETLIDEDDYMSLTSGNVLMKMSGGMLSDEAKTIMRKAKAEFKKKLKK